MSSQKEQFLEVAVLTKPHGIRGEMKVRLHNEESDSLRHATFLVLESPKQKATKYQVESVRGTGRELIIAFANISTKEAANELRSHRVFMHRDSLPKLEADEYFLVDLIGAQLTHLGEVIGVVSAVRPDPSVDTLLINAGNEMIEFPLIDHWVESVDVQKKEIVINSLDGLIRES